MDNTTHGEPHVQQDKAPLNPKAARKFVKTLCKLKDHSGAREYLEQNRHRPGAEFVLWALDQFAEHDAQQQRRP